MNKKGHTLIMSVVFLGLILGGTIILVSQVLSSRTKSQKSYNDVNALYLAEAGVTQAVWCLNNTDQCTDPYTGETLTIGDGSATVTVASAGGNYEVESVGTFGDDTKTVTVTIAQETTTSEASFYYGVQVGDGGLTMDNGASVIGNIYSNGSISGGTITGDAQVAGGTASTASPTQTTYTDDLAFSESGETEQDIAQKFTASVTETINYIELYLKKTSGPNDLTLRIVEDNAGSPDTTTIASGTLDSSLVTTSYGWISTALDNTAELTSGSDYWLIIDTTSPKNGKYYTIGWHDLTAAEEEEEVFAESEIKTVLAAAVLSEPTELAAKEPAPINEIIDPVNDVGGNTNTGGGTTPPTDYVYSSDWTSGSWTDIGGPIMYKIWMGGVQTSLDNVIVGDTGHTCDDAHHLTHHGDAYAQVITNSTIECDVHYENNITGTTYGRNAYSAQDPLAPEVFPISDSQITDWKTAAAAGGTTSDDVTISSNTSLGPQKITGNLSIDSNMTLTVTGTLWVEGNITFGLNSAIELSSGYGANSGMVVTDGLIDVSNNATFGGSGTDDSFIMMLTTSTSDSAVTINNNAEAVIFYAPNGKVTIGNNANLTEVVADSIHLSNNATVTYDEGLASAAFADGPGGEWTTQSSTWQVK